MEAERRQVTVLFTDMVGFTTFSERSGEEAAYTLMRSLSKLMGESVREQGGIVQGFTGDGIMAVFGALMKRYRCWSSNAAVAPLTGSSITYAAPSRQLWRCAK